jgi:hypothetical protein
MRLVRPFIGTELVYIPSVFPTTFANEGELIYTEGTGLVRLYTTETIYLDPPLVEELVARLQRWLDAGTLALPEESTTP